MDAAPSQAELQLAPFTHGTSSTPPSATQAEAVEHLLRAALTHLAPLGPDGGQVEVLRKFFSEIPVPEKWTITLPGGKMTRLPEKLFSAEWDRLKGSRISFDNLVRFSNVSPQSELTGPLLRYLREDPTLTPAHFLPALYAWTQTRIRETLALGETLLRRRDSLDPADALAQTHGVFVGIFTVSRTLRELFDLLSESQQAQFKGLRERCGFLSELYRYQDDILTAGVEPVARESATKRILLFGGDETPRRFQEVLYDRPNAPLSHLWNTVGIDPSSRDIDSLRFSETPPQPRFFGPKTERILGYLRRRLARSETPPAVIVLTNTEWHATYLAEAIRLDSQRDSAGTSFQRPLSVSCVLGTTPTKNRDKAFHDLLAGQLSIVVSTELRSIAASPSTRPVVIVAAAQHATSLTKYSFVTDLRRAGIPVHVIAFRTEGSSDAYARKRAARFRDGAPDHLRSGERPRLFERLSSGAIEFMEAASVELQVDAPPFSKRDPIPGLRVAFDTLVAQHGSRAIRESARAFAGAIVRYIDHALNSFEHDPHDYPQLIVELRERMQRLELLATSAPVWTSSSFILEGASAVAERIQQLAEHPEYFAFEAPPLTCAIPDLEARHSLASTCRSLRDHLTRMIHEESKPTGRSTSRRASRTVEALNSALSHLEEPRDSSVERGTTSHVLPGAPRELPPAHSPVPD